MVTGKHIFVIAKVFTQNLREIPQLFKSMGFFKCGSLSTFYQLRLKLISKHFLTCNNKLI